VTDDGDAHRPRVLLADDEASISSNLAPFLTRSGFDVDVVEDGSSALASMLGGTFDAAVLDVLMPGLDGREVVRRLRRKDVWTPVVLLTQVGESSERAMAVEEGADDYLNKPFDPHELVARVRALLRRAQAGAANLTRAQHVVSGRLRLDRAARRAFLDERELTLTPRALTLLDYLAVHPDELLTRERLLEAVWGWDNPVGTRAVDHRIAELRKALGEDSGNPTWIETVAGLGYRFVGPVSIERDRRV
jgi:DNA-binding response OmpR family regulator